MAIVLRSVRLAVFDLDDTLCLEREFLAGGFRAVAAQLSRRYGAEAEQCYRRLIAMHEAGRRDKFQAILADLGAPADEAAAAELVRLYRVADRPMTLLPDADRALARAARAGAKTAILTDGPAEGQRTKLRLLGLADRVDAVIVTAEYGPELAKPGARGFELLADRFAAPGPSCVYVADNEAKDFAGPNRLSWQTVKVQREGALYGSYRSPDPAYRPRHVVQTLDELEFENV